MSDVRDVGVGEVVVCAEEGCGVEFVKGTWNMRYCDVHRRGGARRRVASGGKRCALRGCNRLVPLKRLAAGAKYCSKGCMQLAKQRAFRLREEERRRVESGSGERRGGVLRRLDERGLAVLVDSGEVSELQAAEALGVSQSAVSRAMAGWRALRRVDERRGEWSRACVTEAMLPQGLLLRLLELGADGVGSVEFEEGVDRLVRAFDVFGRRFFRLEGRRPIHRGFHLKWIREILVAYVTGGKLMILSPPRHGKSELLVRFVVWLIVMFPNIRIGWFCSSGPVAKLMLGAVKDHLGNNENLIRATLPPGESYVPERKSGKPWSSMEIKVAQQSHVGQKSSSMLALGVTSKFLSRDFDLIIIDDMEDFDNTREAASRRYNRAKLAEIGTRKEEHTAEIIIASRQHPDDIPNSILAQQGTRLAWKVIVEAAHDPACTEDPDDWDAHTDCMLFPEVRSYRWLMEKRAEMDALGIPGAYEMRYLNAPLPSEGLVFHVDVIRDMALDRSRSVGVDGLPPGRLIAGLDPASRGTQAAFCWHYVPGRLTMVDLEAQKAGGFAGALLIMEDWAKRFDLRDWFYEDNAQQSEFFNDPRMRQLKRDYGLTITPYTTGKNKQDPEYGISSMAPWYHDGTIRLPYADRESREKVEMLLRQLELWTTDGVRRASRNRKTDIKMASWFPFPRIVRWERQQRHSERVVRREDSRYPGISHTGAVPWMTAYPKAMI